MTAETFMSGLTAYFSDLAETPSYPEQTAAKFNAVLSLLSDFLHNVDPSHTEQVKLDRTRTLIEALNELNASNGYGLLETLERHMIVSGVLEALEQSGVNLDRFDDRDPTLDYRDS